MNYFWEFLGIGLLVFLSTAGLSLIIWSIPRSDAPAFSDDWMDEANNEETKKKVK